MPHYKDTSGHLHFLESAEFEYLLPAGCLKLSDKDAAKLQAEQNKPSAHDLIRLQIIALESQQTPRRVREAALGLDNGWLKNLESEIAALRSQLS